MNFSKCVKIISDMKKNYSKMILVIVFFMLVIILIFFINQGQNKLSSFEMKLTKSQEENIDMKNSGFLLFKKSYGEEDYYQPILDSNNITVNNGIVKAHINNTMLKIDDEGEPWTRGYIFTYYRIENPDTKRVEGIFIKNKYGVSEEIPFAEKVSFYINNKDNRPLLDFVMNDNEKITDNTSCVDLQSKDGYTIYTNAYKITNQNKTYTEEWESSPIVTIHTGLLSYFNKGIENASLDKGEDYAIVFYIQNKSGMRTYSELKIINY